MQDKTNEGKKTLASSYLKKLFLQRFFPVIHPFFSQ